MSSCRDWLTTLWPASYRGVSFQVEMDSGEYGKRVQVHEYPNRDAWYPEELGQKARHHRLTAYLASDTIEAELSALLDVCTLQGAGTLVLPLLGARRAICLEAKTERRKDKHGYVAVNLIFVEDPGIGAAPYPAPFYAGRVVRAAEALVAAMETAFASQYEALTSAGGLFSRPPDHIIAAVAGEIETIAAAVEAERVSASLATRSAAEAAQGLIDLYAAAPALAEGDVVPIGTSVDIASIPAAIMTAVTAFRVAAAPNAAAKVLKHAAAALPLESPAAATLTIPATTGVVAHRVADLVRRTGVTAIATAYSEAIVDVIFETRSAAIQARADVADLFDGIIAVATRQEELQVLIGLRNAVIEFISRTITDLAPVIEVSASRSMPSVWWAYRLYADAARAEELIARNGASHPSFMPSPLEALAR
ncbi:DNA circularization N-terminal domain-containing protein [Microbaculum marinisediminis]|uniref:DNA circularization N-terminal domain-containing protein n=1 Tax=Microbaculum marinisediminis TaxID=2931392 RepID=A0AAW5QWB2_9HYPH|nr:DNA circularization N-terminal domain-containing protein [Microbaculum sp. A6E488]MCT8970580.1 DNA circularization N-terminal domain-containing protein [Microbaculum sp. A6E488]